jgi:hypothetical protein
MDTVISPDAKSLAALLGEIQITVGHGGLDFACTAHASTTLANSANTPSPVVCSRIFGSMSSTRCVLTRSCVPSSPAPNQARIAQHIGGEDRGETAGVGRGGHRSGTRLFSCVRAFKWDRLSPRKN